MASKAKFVMDLPWLRRTMAGVDKLKGTLTGLHLTYNRLRGILQDALFALMQLWMYFYLVVSACHTK